MIQYIIQVYPIRVLTSELLPCACITIPTMPADADWSGGGGGGLWGAHRLQTLKCRVYCILPFTRWYELLQKPTSFIFIFIFWGGLQNIGLLTEIDKEQWPFTLSSWQAAVLPTVVLHQFNLPIFWPFNQFIQWWKIHHQIVEFYIKIFIS